MSLITRILISTAIGIICGMVCSNLARDRRKNPMLWFQIGFFFGLLGIALFYIKLFVDKTRGPRLAEEPVIVQSSSEQAKAAQAVIEDKAITTIEKREWFFLDASNKQMGPISFKELKEDYEAGKVDESTQLWSEGMESWMPLSKLPYLKLVLTS